MSQLKELKENILKRFEAEKDELKTEMKEKFSLLIDAINLKQKREHLKLQTCELSAKNKNQEEQVEVKESEKIEYEEGDLKTSMEYVDQIKRDNKKIERKLNDKQTAIMEMYSQAEAVINQLMKYKQKLAEIPAIKNADQIGAETTLENLKFKLNAAKQAIKDSHEQESVSLTKIAEVETKSSKVLTKSEELSNHINIEKTLAAKIDQYQQQIIPDIANEVEKIQTNVLSVENIIYEKNEAQGVAIKRFNDLNAKVRSEQAKDMTMHETLHNITRLKNDIINNKFSSKDIDGNPNLKDLASTKEFQKQKEKINKLTADNAQITKDAKAARVSKDESEKIMDKLKEEVNKDEEVARVKREEILALEKDIDSKGTELESLNDIKMELAKAIEINAKEKVVIKSNIAELNATYKQISKKLKSVQNKYIDSDEKAVKESQVLVNNNKNNVHKWLNDLPQKFSKNTTKSDILSQNSTVNMDDTNMNISIIRQIQSNSTSNESHLFNLEIDDPEVIEANMECSFSDLNCSDISFDDSFLKNDIFNI